MLRFEKKIVIISVIWCVGSVAFFTRRTPLLQLLALPLFLLFFITSLICLVCVFTEWRKHHWRSLFPFAVCVIASFLSGMLVQDTRNMIFDWALPSYEAVIRQMESGSIKVSAGFDGVPQAKKEARLAYAVFAEKDSKGVLMVEFDTEGGFPVKHSGYLYSSSGVIEPGSRMDSRWPIRHELRRKWFYVSN